MTLVSIDLETYYSSDYSLSKMSELEYILDPRFQVIGAAVKIDAGPSEWIVGAEALRRRLALIDWSKAALLNHNARFDAAILFWHFGIEPRFYFDTLSMARAMIHCITGKSSLHAVAKYLGLGQKGDEVVRAIGLRLEDFSPLSLAQYGDYCINDNDLCHAAFKRMLPRFPKDELRVIDQSLRMFVQPQLMLLEDVLSMHLTAVRAEKERTFATVAQYPREVFSSNAQFAALLTSHGVEVPMKTSPTDPTKEIPALARNDRAFKELQQDPDQPPMVQALLAARVGAKSTIEETRTEKLLAFSRVRWPDGMPGWLPVPLKYYAAHTGRFGGDGGFNMQNIRRDSAIRKAIVAPPGYAIVTRDASQIEARMVAWLAGQHDLIEAFAGGRDVYSEFASTVFGRKITKADKVERFIGKTGILGLGYGCGADKFRHMLFIGSGGISVNIDINEASRIVHLYRRKYSLIQFLWETFNHALIVMEFDARGAHPNQVAGTVSYLREQLSARLPKCVRLGHDAIWLPNGMPIAYPDLHSTFNGVQYEASYRGAYGERKRIYGAKVVENVSQALARLVVTNIMMRVWAERRLHPCLQVHDSLAYVVPIDEAPEFDRYLEGQFAIRPHWAPALPLASEGGYGRTLAEAEGK